MFPSPQAAALQTVVQASVLAAFPSSQASPVSATPSPQEAEAQSERQALATVSELLPPLSHASPAAVFATPSPQTGTVQSASQATVAVRASQVSPRSTTPSPQLGSSQALRQALEGGAEGAAPASHPSPSCKTSSPHVDSVQEFVQLSVFTLLPSSHDSPESSTPSPHDAASQLVRQAFATVFELLFPESHSSP